MRLVEDTIERARIRLCSAPSSAVFWSPPKSELQWKEQQPKQWAGPIWVGIKRI